MCVCVCGYSQVHQPYIEGNLEKMIIHMTEVCTCVSVCERENSELGRELSIFIPFQQSSSFDRVPYRSIIINLPTHMEETLVSVRMYS